jgi:hypothetical protein
MVDPRLLRHVLPICLLVLTACASSNPADVTTTTVDRTEAAASAPAPPVTSSSDGEPDRNVRVPSSTQPVIDGSLGALEWEAATQSSMSDGGAVYLLQSDSTLYVAVQSDEIGSVNVVLATEAEVWILHSSAALGSARYLSAGPGWTLAHGFDWCCRSASDQTERDALFSSEGWDATIGFAGDPGVVEYAIDLPWEGAALAVSTVRDANDRGFWPASLSVDARTQIVGVPPSERSFTTAEWMILEN